MMISSQNEKDGEPKTYHNLQTLSETEPQWWHDGNGGGSEKTDWFQELGHWSESADDFHNKAWKQVWIPSLNSNDKAPHTYSFAQLKRSGQMTKSQEEQERWYWHDEAATSSSEKEFYDRAAKPKLPAYNYGDAEPKEGNQ